MNKSRFGLVPIGTSKCILQDARTSSHDQVTLNPDTRKLDIHSAIMRVCLFMDEFDRVIFHHIPVEVQIEIGKYYNVTVVEKYPGRVEVERFTPTDK